MLLVSGCGLLISLYLTTLLRQGIACRSFNEGMASEGKEKAVPISRNSLLVLCAILIYLDLNGRHHHRHHRRRHHDHASYFYAYDQSFPYAYGNS